MAARIRNKSWTDDEALKSDLNSYVRKNFKREEILDFVSEKYSCYAWSLGSLCRRLRYFDIKYIDYNVDLEDIEKAVREELKGPGKLLGYRALHKKIREVHELNVPRDLVYVMMDEVDPSGLEERGGVGKAKRPKRNGAFTSKGSDWTMSLDGHDKLCGYQKAMFPLRIYGGLDTYSNIMNFLRIWTTKNNPYIVGRFYLEYLFESRVLPARLRVDRGTETGVIATMHSYLRSLNGDLTDPVDSIMYGPSTQNKIERWWKELLERMERFFKVQLNELTEDGDYEYDCQLDRDLLAYIYIPVLQKELDIFRNNVWNPHRCRKQKEKELPDGIPEHIYHFPEQYGGERCGFPVTENQLREVAELSDVLEGTEDYLETEFRAKCATIIPNVDEIKPEEAGNAYLYLKANFPEV